MRSGPVVGRQYPDHLACIFKTPLTDIYKSISLNNLDLLRRGIVFINTFEQLIEQHLPVRFDMQLASDYLQMSERHLRRSLLLEGISFQQIRQTVLERKAKQMLENNLSIGDISQALGFREVREFRRAFKRWTGQAPSVYKNGTE